MGVFIYGNVKFFDFFLECIVVEVKYFGCFDLVFVCGGENG